MLRQNTNALGIIFPNSYDNTVPELVTERAMASIPFAGRYRMVDFVLSSMANCGISNVSIVVRKNYHSLMDHLGTGREWDMARRHGGLNIVPPFAEKGVRIYSGRVEALGSILSFLEHQKEKYVVMSDANIAVNYDFNALLAAHQASGADVTVAYQKTEIPEGRKNDNYTLTIDADGRVTELLFNDYRSGVQNLDLNIYVLERETLIKLVKDATARGLIYFERDILAHNVNILNIHALEYTGYVAHICDMKSYFDENLKLIDDRNLEALFPKGSPIYTKIRDDNPTRYVTGSKVVDSILADGCVIEGTVENCVLFRGVKVKKGAVVKNCVLMQDTVVEPNVELDCVVTGNNRFDHRLYFIIILTIIDTECPIYSAGSLPAKVRNRTTAERTVRYIHHFIIRCCQDRMKNLDFLHRTARTLRFDIVTDFEWLEQKNNQSTRKICQITAQSHTDSNTCRSKKSSKRSRLYTQSTDNRDDQ